MRNNFSWQIEFRNQNSFSRRNELETLKHFHDRNELSPRSIHKPTNKLLQVNNLLGQSKLRKGKHCCQSNFSLESGFRM